jgi:hypothetical protein
MQCPIFMFSCSNDAVCANHIAPFDVNIYKNSHLGEIYLQKPLSLLPFGKHLGLLYVCVPVFICTEAADYNASYLKRCMMARTHTSRKLQKTWSFRDQISKIHLSRHYPAKSNILINRKSCSTLPARDRQKIPTESNRRLK